MMKFRAGSRRNTLSLPANGYLGHLGQRDVQVCITAYWLRRLFCEENG
jgi:hypothetical protein